MSSISQENSQGHNEENELTINHQLDNIIGGDSNNGIFDNVTINQSDHSSSAESNSGTNAHNRSERNLLSIAERTNNQRYLDRKMILYYSREFFWFVILLLGTYATFQNIPPKISKISAGKPFFPKGSLVTDWPDGRLAATQSKVALSDLSFVLFYAPWCAESQHARISYEYVARLFHQEAQFSAINCWQPGGECRGQYTKVMAWPVLMAYLQNGLAVSYNGQWNNRELTQFIRALMNPLKRLSNPKDLLELMTSNDAVVVSFVDVMENRSQYWNFYKASVKWIEKYPKQEVVFGVVTGKAMHEFGVERSPTIRLYLWNDTMAFENTTWTQPDIAKWLSTNINQISAWLSPPGSKSTMLASYMKGGPALMFFVPRIHYAESNDGYIMLQQIALEYYHCPSFNGVWIQDMSRDFMTQQRIKYREQYKEFQESCKRLSKNVGFRLSQRCPQSTVSVSFANIVNSSNEKLSGQRIFGPKNINEQTSCPSDRYYKHNVDLCDAEPMLNYDVRSDNKVATKLDISMLHAENDDRRSDSLIERDLRLKCEMFADEDNVVFFDDKDQEVDFDSIWGLSCTSNRTLSFLAIDSILYHTFAERLGVNALKNTKKSVVLIMDNENESTYILKEVITANNIIHFIKNFHNKKLTRHLKSKSKKHLTSATTKRYVPIKEIITLREINSDSFVDQVISSNKTVAVLFYSTQCALCSLMSHTLMVASRILQELDRIDFVRIDGDRNDLPWQYTIDKFPALLIFSENRKTESRIYPLHIQVNIQNILGFLLANMNRPIRLYALVLICQHMHKNAPHDDCFPALRKEIMDSISYSLQQWRIVPHHRSQIYRRLQILQRMYLHLFRIIVSCDFGELLEYVSDIRRVWTMV